MLKRIAAACLAAALVMTAAGADIAGAAELGEDGLHKQPWFQTTFKDVAEDLSDATEAGKRLVIFFEQRGCIYCTKMHEEVFSDPEVAAYIHEHFYVVQMNLFGDEEVTDFDGEALPEKEMAARWGVLFTPTILFMPETAPDGPASAAAVAQIPGAFGKFTTLHMFQWVREKGYEGDEHFQKYHSRKFNARQG
ncbi:MAG: thioredoxin family protein [Pseudomonadota bacterium]